MRLIAIAAFDEALGLGFRGGLPWPRLPRDMQRFKHLSLGGAEGRGRPVLMGSRTYQSLGGRLLPGRQIVVLSRNPDFRRRPASTLPATSRTPSTWRARGATRPWSRVAPTSTRNSCPGATGST
jgi:dihydrofolate reductase